MYLAETCVRHHVHILCITTFNATLYFHQQQVITASAERVSRMAPVRLCGLWSARAWLLTAQDSAQEVCQPRQQSPLFAAQVLISVPVSERKFLTERVLLAIIMTPACVYRPPGRMPHVSHVRLQQGAPLLQ